MAALIVLTAGCPVMAQTNTDISATIKTNTAQRIIPAPWYPRLYAATNKIAALEAQKKRIFAAKEDAIETSQLKFNAKKITNSEHETTCMKAEAEAQKKTKLIDEEIAKQMLEEKNVRKTFGLPVK